MRAWADAAAPTAATPEAAQKYIANKYVATMAVAASGCKTQMEFKIRDGNALTKFEQTFLNASDGGHSRLDDFHFSL